MLRKTSYEQMKTIGNEINPYENDGSESGCDLSEHLARTCTSSQLAALACLCLIENKLQAFSKNERCN